jgi:hypothetical protein
MIPFEKGGELVLFEEYGAALGLDRLITRAQWRLRGMHPTYISELL